MSHWALAAVFLLLALNGAQADQFVGRALVLTDARTTDAPAPLIIALHGFTGTGPSLRRKTRFEAVARRERIVVAYPSGIARRWNDRGTAPDDIAYLSALITALVRDGLADPARIFLVGHSNGGAMALRMACARPDLIRAIAVVAMNGARRPNCTDAGPMAALFIHGTADPIVPPEGLPPGRRHDGFLSTKDTLAGWVARNRCTGTGLTQVFDQIADGTRAQITSYRGCSAPLVHVRLVGHGHEWPGAGPRAVWLQGPASMEMDAADYSWRFFANQ